MTRVIIDDGVYETKFDFNEAADAARFFTDAVNHARPDILGKRPTIKVIWEDKDGKH